MTFLRFLKSEPAWYYGLTLASTALPAVSWWLIVIPVALVAALLWVRT